MAGLKAQEMAGLKAQVAQVARPRTGILTEKEANILQANPNEVKVLSFDSKSGTKSMINEKPNATDFGIEITNNTNEKVTIAVVSGLGVWKSGEAPGEFFQDYFPGGFMDGDDLLTRVGADCVLADGTLHQVGSDLVSARATNTRRKINELTKYASKAPFRFTRFVMSSYKVTGEPESTNYNNDMKTLWVSPFEDTVEQTFSLRTIVRDRFQAQNLELDFQKDAPNLNPIMSDEHIIVIQVNPKTILNIQAHIGARFSTPQYFYRITKSADEIVRQF